MYLVETSQEIEWINFDGDEQIAQTAQELVSCLQKVFFFIYGKEVFLDNTN